MLIVWSLEDVRMILFFFPVGTARAGCVSSLHSALWLVGESVAGCSNEWITDWLFK